MQNYYEAFRAHFAATNLTTYSSIHAPLAVVQSFSDVIAQTPHCDVMRGGRCPDCMASRRHLRDTKESPARFKGNSSVYQAVC